MEENDEGEMEFAGTKMKAEGETGYEPHVLIRMKSEWQKDGTFQISAFFEKDRSGILTGRKIPNPNFDTIAPILPHLGAGTQGKIGSTESSAEKDAAKIQEAEERTARERQELFEQIRTAIVGAQNVDALKTAWDLTKGKKGKLGELFEKLELAKDARKGELMQAVA